LDDDDHKEGMTSNDAGDATSSDDEEDATSSNSSYSSCSSDDEENVTSLSSPNETTTVFVKVLV
jgi:hypothetical protein